MKPFLQRSLAMPAVANIRGFKSIAVALCFGITICLAGIANAETVTYSWTGNLFDLTEFEGTDSICVTQ